MRSIAVSDQQRRSRRSRRTIWIPVLICGVGLGAAGLLAARGHLASLLAERDARRAMARGQWSEASAALARWLALRPDSAEAHFLKAKVAFEQGRFSDVAPSVDRAQWLGYPERPLYRLRALVLVRLRQFIEAEPILLHLVDESAAPDPQVDEALTRVFLETYQLENAITVIQRWIRDEPTNPRPYLWWTEVDRRLEVDNPAAMERHYRSALRLDPNLAEARLGLADTLRHLHRWDEAIREYEVYETLKPSDAACHIGAAQIALERGDEATARRHLDRALEIAPANPITLKLLAGIDLRRGDDSAAVSRLDRAIVADPLDVDSLYKRSLALRRLGRVDEAELDRRNLEKLRQEQLEVVRIRDRLNANPNNNDIRLEMARWMLDHGREDEAIRWLRNIISAQPKHAKALQLLARYHQGRGEFGLANYYRSRAESAP